MRLYARHSLVVITTMLLIGVLALAGTVRADHDDSHWDEAGDAGDLPVTAQVPEGSGPLSSITGAVAGEQDADMYAICVLEPAEFSASTAADGGSTEFDSILFLFNEEGFGVYFNDDESALGGGSTLPAGHVDGPSVPGIYYVAISVYEFKPVSATGLIFPRWDVDDQFAVLGPVGAGGKDSITSWDLVTLSNGKFGMYTIALTGAAYPSECDVDNGDESDGVVIDIKPGDEANSVDPESNGVIPVAVLSSASFDATTVDPSSLTFGALGDEESLHLRGGKHKVPNCGVEDVNGDGLDDLVCHFWTQATGLSAGDTEAVLRGATLDGDEFEASDSVEMVGAD